MKKTFAAQNMACSEVEDLLTQASVEALPEAVAASLEEHVQACPQCLAYRETLAGVQSSTKFSAHSELIPDAAIYFNLVQRVKENVASQPRSFGAIAHRLFAPLRYRVPLYQAALGAAMLFLIFSTMHSALVSKPASLTDSVRVVQTNGVNLRLYQDSTLTDSLRIGRNIKEDSLLLRFIHTAM